MAFVRPYQGRFYFVVVLTVLLGILGPIRPMLIQYTLDRHVAVGDYQGLVLIMWALLGLLILQTIVQYSHTYVSGRIGQFVIRDIRVKLYQHIVRLQLRFFDRTPIGRLVTRTISDVESLADVFTEGLAAMAGDLLQIIFILGFMFWTDWRLALVSLSTVPLMLLATYIFKEKVKVGFNEVRNAIANLNTFVQEHISGMTVVQAFAAEKGEMEKFRTVNKEHLDSNLRSVLYYSVYYPVAEIISAMGIGLLMWYGAQQALHWEATGITIGTLTAFILYIQMFFRPIRMIADRYNTLQMGIVSSARIIQLLDSREHAMDGGDHRPSSVAGAVRFNDVWFAYQGEEFVLKGINLDIRPGETLALVGQTGSGKSTVINLLSRFYEVSRGSVEIDGVDVRRYDLAVLRRSIGVVLQDVFLFSDTIRNNIALNDPAVTDKQIMHAADLVGARSFIERLPGGLDYNVMERGSTLSVGQRQLLSFIRAMVYEPRILVLDEATSSVDQETEEMIRQAIDKMMAGRTSVVIAHRLSTIQKADRIVVLEKGEITESGTHQELLAHQGIYAQLHQLQYRVS